MADQHSRTRSSLPQTLQPECAQLCLASARARQPPSGWVPVQQQALLVSNGRSMRLWRSTAPKQRRLSHQAKGTRVLATHKLVKALSSSHRTTAPLAFCDPHSSKQLGPLHVVQHHCTLANLYLMQTWPGSNLAASVKLCRVCNGPHPSKGRSATLACSFAKRYQAPCEASLAAPMELCRACDRAAPD